MSNYFSHFTAAEYWNIPYIDVVYKSTAKEQNLLNITAYKNHGRTRNKDIKVYYRSLDLPSRAIVSKNGVMVSSPELMFLELASILTMHRLILLGLQMCSHPPGKPAMAVTTKQKLNSFLSKTQGHKGHRKAANALKYIENGSASIMESIAYMILTLPHSLGGYGLHGAVFNHEISLNSEAQRCLKQYRCITDLYYKKAKLAVEYESFAHHSRPSEQGKDMTRAALLERMGIAVMHFSTVQLFDKDACRTFAYNLAVRIKRRMQIRAKKFDQMHVLLRSLLPVREK